MAEPTDPAPWVHVGSLERVTHFHAPGAPVGGYTFCPRREYSDYPDRFRSTRRAEAEYCEAHGMHHHARRAECDSAARPTERETTEGDASDG